MTRLQLFGVLAFLNLALNAAILPYHFNYRHYFCGDAGSSLMATHMVSQGVTPWLDFNYYYGFGTLWLNQGWFSLFGYHPVANYALNMLCLLLVTFGTADMLVTMGWNRNKVLCGLALLLSPYLFCFCWFTTAHTLEAALVILSLSHALRRSYTISLLLATLALLVKPSIAYFVGLYIVIMMLTDRQTPWRQHLGLVVRQMLPSLLLLVGYSAYVLFAWGPLVYVNSLLPLSGMAGYQQSACGFFNRGTLFWLPPMDNVWQLLEHYLLTPAGLWVAGTLFLSCHTIVTLLRWLSTRTLTLADQCVVIFGTLHLIFIFILFGNEWSWTYEPFLLLFGTSAVLSRYARLTMLFLPLLAALVVCSLTRTAQAAHFGWTETASFADRHYLFMTAQTHQDLQTLEKQAAQHPTLFMGRQGAPGLLLKGVAATPTWAFMHASIRDAERLGLQKLIQQSDIIAIPQLPYVTMMTKWPEIAEQMKDFRNTGGSATFQYWARSTVKPFFNFHQ